MSQFQIVGIWTIIIFIFMGICILIYNFSYRFTPIHVLTPVEYVDNVMNNYRLSKMSLMYKPVFSINCTKYNVLDTELDLNFIEICEELLSDFNKFYHETTQDIYFLLPMMLETIMDTENPDQNSAFQLQSGIQWFYSYMYKKKCTITDNSNMLQNIVKELNLYQYPSMQLIRFIADIGVYHCQIGYVISKISDEEPIYIYFKDLCQMHSVYYEQSSRYLSRYSVFDIYKLAYPPSEYKWVNKQTDQCKHLLSNWILLMDKIKNDFGPTKVEPMIQPKDMVDYYKRIKSFDIDINNLHESIVNELSKLFNQDIISSITPFLSNNF